MIENVDKMTRRSEQGLPTQTYLRIAFERFGNVSNLRFLYFVGKRDDAIRHSKQAPVLGHFVQYFYHELHSCRRSGGI
jgi:hypothetical protein